LCSKKRDGISGNEIQSFLREAKRIGAMATLKPEEEEILTFDVSDEALEIAGSGKTHFTLWGLHSGSAWLLSVNLCR